MSRFARRTSASVLLVVAALVGVVLALSPSGHAGSRANATTYHASAGDPDRGREAFIARGCLGCHALSDPGSRKPLGPMLTPELLSTDAASAGKPVDAFVVESLLAPNAFISPGYLSNLMKPANGLARQEFDDIVSFLIGAPYTSPPGGVKLPANPVAACKADSKCRSTVARWARSVSLPPGVLEGARIVAKAGCLSCHRYAGSGATSGAAPELTRIGSRGIPATRLVRKLSCPTCLVEGSVMPSYSALGKENLNRVAQFLLASKGTKK